MSRSVLYIVALLLANLTGVAAAAEDPEHKSKGARKLLATLDSIGVNNHDVENLVAAADAHVENNYFYFTQQQAAGGSVSLRYHLGSSDNAAIPNSDKRLELRYAPKDSHFAVTAQTNSVMLSYKLQLQ